MMGISLPLHYWPKKRVTFAARFQMVGFFIRWRRQYGHAPQPEYAAASRDDAAF